MDVLGIWGGVSTSMHSSDSPVNHAKQQQQQREGFCCGVESNQIGLSTMLCDHDKKKEDEEDTPKDDGKDLPLPWAAAIARQIITAVEEAGRREWVSQPGTLGKYIRIHGLYC